MKKLITSLLLLASPVLAQYVPVQYSTNGDERIVWGDTNGISTNVIGYSSGCFKPAYGSLLSYQSPYEVADSVIVSNATITSGTVTNTWTNDASYFVIQETGVFEEYYVFTNSSSAPRILTFHGRYEGNPSHYVKFQAFDYTNGVYSNFTVATTDLPSSSTDSSLRFAYNDPAINYVNTNGESRVRIYHIGTAISSHYLYVDFLRITYANAMCTNSGVWYPLAGFTVGQSNNIIPDGTAGIITTVDAGDYNWEWHVSFAGLTNTTFAIRHLTNGTPSGVQSIRTIGTTPQVGSMSAFGGGRIPASCTNSWQISSDNDNAYVVFVNGTAKVRKDAD